MELRFEHSKKEVSRMNTGELRDAFLVRELIKDDSVTYTYSHYDRLIIGGAKPLHKVLTLEADPELRSAYFLERREVGIINVGGSGVIEADGIAYDVDKLSCLYLGKGTQEVSFSSRLVSDPAIFFILSATAHASHPNRLMKKEEVVPVHLGDISTANKRTIYKYIHLDGIKSCQLAMGLTALDNGSVWNSIPPHTHTRRTEVYFYFDVPETQRVFHFMGEPKETRHLIMENNEAVISPPWSLHCGAGTSNYSFIWGMAGENQVYNDMDALTLGDLR